MVIDMLWRIFTRRNYRVVVATPYENQVRLIFMRINEILQTSPLLKQDVVKNTKNPYIIEVQNGSAIIGFTTGNDAASVRGQKADILYLDEVDYMDDVCFDAVTAIAAERADIGITMSSTPTGKRSHFYKACMDKKMGYVEHYHPSTHNPNWGPAMEAEFKAQLTAQAYVHEILAEFGTQNAGVFPKEALDRSITYENYTYNPLTYDQQRECKAKEIYPNLYLYDQRKKAPFNIFRTMGVDWDKYGASSSILILDYNVKYKKFQVIKRVEVPRGEYSYDNAVKKIIELNEIYNPSYIYCDAGSGEYQIEALHIYGDKNPASGLKNKVKRWQFSNTLDVPDPITGEIHKEPLKPFMVNQLTISFERDRMILSPLDDTLFKQLQNYEVEKIAANGKPVYTSVDEHFVDALGLAHLAFVLEFKELTNTIKDFETTTKIEFSSNSIGKAGANLMFNEIQSGYASPKYSLPKSDDLRGNRQTWIKVPLNDRGRSSSISRSSGWGNRSSRSSFGGRSMW